MVRISHIRFALSWSVSTLLRCCCSQVAELAQRIRLSGRDHPVPKLSERKLLQLKRKAEAEVIEQRKREEALQDQQLQTLVQPPLETAVAEAAVAQVC